MTTQAAAGLDSNAPAVRLRVMTISRAVDHWLGELERKSHSERTIDTYRRLLDKLSDAYPHIDVDELTAAMIRRFLDDHAKRLDGRRKAPRTIAQNVTIVNGFMDWLAWEGVIARNPTRRNGQRIISRPPLPDPITNDNVTTISGADVGRLLDTADTMPWNRRLAVYALASFGSRRRALATARLEDYDPSDRTIVFREKGAKTIAKPVPDAFADLLHAAIAAGVYASLDDYLIPGRAQQRRKGDRDDRIIWHLVRDVARQAGVRTHVHALRAAFAVEYLETHERDVLALKDLMGHKRIATTEIYLRRMERREAMETVRDLDWRRHRSPQTAAKPFEANAGTEKEGFEPSFLTDALLERARSQRAADVPTQGPA